MQNHPPIEAAELYKQIPTEQAANFLGVSVRQLENWRQIGGGPNFVKNGHRLVRYRIKELIEFQEAHLVNNTVQARQVIGGA